MYIEKLTSQIINDVLSGLGGYHSNLSINRNQVADEIVALRLSLLKDYYLKGIYPIKDLLMAINCIEVDCNSLERCSCVENTKNVKHFQIPQIVTQYGKQAIQYLGSIDRQNKFRIVTSLTELQNIKYKRRQSNKPIVWIDTAPNENGMLDCFLFNAPFVKQISIVAVFKDPRQLQQYSCCSESTDDNVSFIDQQIKDKLTKEKIYYYRQLKAPILPNNQQYT